MDTHVRAKHSIQGYPFYWLSRFLESLTRVKRPPFLKARERNELKKMETHTKPEHSLQGYPFEWLSRFLKTYDKRPPFLKSIASHYDK